MDYSREDKNQIKGAFVTLTIHLLILLIIFFVVVWERPFPPLPSYGMEINWGMDAQGSQNNPNTSSSIPTPVEEVEEEVEESVEEEVAEEIPEEEVVEQEETHVEEEVAVDDNTIPAVEEKVEKRVVEKKVEKKKEPEKEVKKTDVTGSLYPDKEASENNEGDDKNEKGNKGEEKGLDERGLYKGVQGQGGGSSLDLAGWVWDFKPKPNDQSDENGKIVFEIKVDDEGEIISYRTVEKTVGPAVEKVYQRAIEELTFSRTSDNARTAPVSVGKITFIIKSK